MNVANMLTSFPGMKTFWHSLIRMFLGLSMSLEHSSPTLGSVVQELLSSLVLFLDGLDIRELVLMLVQNSLLKVSPEVYTAFNVAYPNFIDNKQL